MLSTPAVDNDIGKIAVPSEILSRPGKLLDEDVSYLQIHCRKGFEILDPVDFPWPVAEIALQHHEHMDGSGYPQGLQAAEILTEAAIVCVADVVESLTAHRPYRPAYQMDQALSEISRRAGKWYDRAIVAACIELFEKGFRIDAVDMAVRLEDKTGFRLSEDELKSMQTIQDVVDLIHGHF